MLGIFKTNQLTTTVLLLFYLLLLRLPAMIFPALRTPVDWSGGFLGEWLAANSILSEYLYSEIFLITIIFLQVVVLCIFIFEHRLGRETTLFAGVFYILIVSTIPYFLNAAAVLTANMFLLFSLWEMNKTYRSPSCADTIFNIGLWMGMASLFYISYSVFLIWAIVGLNVMRALRFKEVLMVLVGFFTPYFLLGVWFFWVDALPWFYEKQVVATTAFFDFEYFGTIEEWLGFGFFAFLLLVVLVSPRQYMIKQNIQIQKKIRVIYWLLFISAFSVIFQASVDVRHLLILALPLSIFISFNFANMSAKWAESLHFLWLVFVIIIKFLPFISVL